VELLAFADACRRSAAARVVAVVPYFGYARGDKREGRRVPVTASLVAALMETAGVSQVLTVDIHSAQMEGFFRIPMDTLSAVPLLCGALEGRLPEGTTVVSPDAGRVKTASEFAERLGLPLTVLSKHRESGTRTRVTHIVGDVRGRPCLIVDDMISTGGTIAESAEALRGAGASGPFIVVATHGLLMGDACRRMAVHGVEEIVLTDSVPARGRSTRTTTIHCSSRSATRAWCCWARPRTAPTSSTASAPASPSASSPRRASPWSRWRRTGRTRTA
jgi:ribose-phosphate pyrophosphokinase